MRETRPWSLIDIRTPRADPGDTTSHPHTETYIDEPIAWESVIASVRMQGKAVKSISLRPVVLNTIGDGQPDVHDPYADNEFLHTRGLPTAATGARAGILQRVADASKPFRTTVVIADGVATITVGR